MSEDAATAMGTPPQAVASTVHRAKSVLRCASGVNACPLTFVRAKDRNRRYSLLLVRRVYYTEWTIRKAPFHEDSILTSKNTDALSLIRVGLQLNCGYLRR